LTVFLLQTIDIRLFYEKFPSGKGGLKDLYDRGPQSAFFLVKFWVSSFTNPTERYRRRSLGNGELKSGPPTSFPTHKVWAMYTNVDVYESLPLFCVGLFLYMTLWYKAMYLSFFCQTQLSCLERCSTGSTKLHWLFI